jgi:F-type H+-transporting ATPase subunit epsilon
MAHPFDVAVVAADHKVYSGQAVSVVVPAADGYLGILAGHAPLVAALQIGEVRIIQPDHEVEIIAVSGGFVRVDQGNVTVLADTAERSIDIDVLRAEQAVARAEERLRGTAGEIDLTRASAALMRAMNRLRVARGR